MENDIHPESMPDYLETRELRALQLQRLKTTVQRCYDHVALFRQRMDERSLKPADIQCLEDMAKLPFMEWCTVASLRPTFIFLPFMSGNRL